MQKIIMIFESISSKLRCNRFKHQQLTNLDKKVRNNKKFRRSFCFKKKNNEVFESKSKSVSKKEYRAKVPPKKSKQVLFVTVQNMKSTPIKNDKIRKALTEKDANVDNKNGKKHLK